MHNKLSLGALLAVGIALAQQPTQLSFEVATVRAAQPGEVKSAHTGMQVDGAQVNIEMMPLSNLIREAYGLGPYRLSNPDWMASQRYDIHAKLPSGATTDQVPAMLQALLTERFKLTFHHESKDHATYALTVAKSGLKIKPAEADATPPSGPKYTVSGGLLRVDRDMTMQEFCDFLGPFVDRPLVDQTGLAGRYHVTFELPAMELKRAAMSAQGMRPPGDGDSASDPTGGSPIFVNVQKMGLELHPRNAPLEILVVDHAEKTPIE